MSSRAAEQFVLHQLDDEVLQGHVHHLDLAGLVRPDDDGMVYLCGEQSAIATKKGGRAGGAGPRRSGGRYQVGAPAAGAVKHQQVARSAEGVDLPGEDLLEAEVVPGGGEERGVGGERDGGERPTGEPEAHDVLGGQVLRVRRAAAVPAEVE